MRIPHLAAALLVATVAIAACSGEPDTTPSPTVPPTTASDTVTPSPTTAVTPTASPTPTPSPTPSPAPIPSPTPTPTPLPSPTPTTAPVPDDLSTITDDGEVTVAEAQAVIDIQNQIYNDAVLLEYLTTRRDSGGRRCTSSTREFE